MTKFAKENFIKSGDFLHYDLNGERKFVARFKRSRSDMNRFITFLTKNFTAEEYFAKLEEERVAPLKILQDKGYLSTNVRKILKNAGYPLTMEGYDQYLEAKIAARY